MQPDESTPILHLAKGESEARIQGEPGTADQQLPESSPEQILNSEGSLQDGVGKDQQLASKAGTPCVAVGGLEHRDDNIGECFKPLQLGPLLMSTPSPRQQGRGNRTQGACIGRYASISQWRFLCLNMNQSRRILMQQMRPRKTSVLLKSPFRPSPQSIPGMKLALKLPPRSSFDKPIFRDLLTSQSRRKAFSRALLGWKVRSIRVRAVRESIDDRSSLYGP